MSVSNTDKDDIKHQVKVLGPNNEFVSYTHPARARKLIGQGRAFVLSTTPFIIKMKGDNSERKVPMQKKSHIINFTEMFKEEKDIWVQNLGKTQISLQFETAPGRIASVCVPRTKAPFHLSARIPFAAIKSSMDLRIMLNRRPARLQILTQDEAMEYFAERAKDLGTSAEEEAEKAFDQHTALMEHIAYTAPETEKPKTVEELVKEAEANATEEDAVNPRVIGLIQQADPSQKDGEKMAIRELKEEFEVLEDELTAGDLDYIINLAPKSIQKWAMQVKSARFPVEYSEEE